jgi:hypothetical protein
MKCLLMNERGFLARAGFPDRYTHLARYAQRFPLDEHTVRLATVHSLTIFNVAPAGSYSPDPIRNDERFVSHLAGAAA